MDVRHLRTVYRHFSKRDSPQRNENVDIIYPHPSIAPPSPPDSRSAPYGFLLGLCHLPPSSLTAYCTPPAASHKFDEHIDTMRNLRVFSPPDWSPHPGLPPLSAPLLPPFTHFGQSSSVLFYLLMDTVAVDRRSHYRIAEPEPSGSLRDLFTL
jgi:hypothetical protein